MICKDLYVGVSFPVLFNIFKKQNKDKRCRQKIVQITGNEALPFSHAAWSGLELNILKTHGGVSKSCLSSLLSSGHHFSLRFCSKELIIGADGKQGIIPWLAFFFASMAITLPL